VVLIVAIAALIPALASGHSAPRAASGAIFCPLSNDRGLGVLGHLKTLKHHRRHHRRHHSAGPSTPIGATACNPIPCPTPYAVEPWGHTGVTGGYIVCRPIPCVYGATGTTGTTGILSPLPFCRPIPCVFVAPVGQTGVEQPATLLLPCRPIPCDGVTGESCPPEPCPPVAVGATSGAGEPDVLCRPIVCPLGAATTRTNGARTAIIACPPCPPPVTAGTARPATAVLHACPMVRVLRPARARAGGIALKTQRAT
jgi:hypothetical protein